MRSSLIAMMLAFAKCQQVCQIDKIVDYTDPECKNEHEFHNKTTMEFMLNRSNEVIRNGDYCQRFFEPPSNDTRKVTLTCLNSETLKVEPANYKQEDEECKYPYPEYSAYPSYIAKNGDCVKTSYMSYSRIYISSTTGTFEEVATASWDLAPHDKDANTQTLEEDQEKLPYAKECMVADFRMYEDSTCTREKMDDPNFEKAKDYYMYIQNQAIQSEECVFPQNNEEYGIKSRAYCTGPSSVRFNFYNLMEEDRRCLRPYPDFAEYDNSLTANAGECVRIDNLWYRFEILPYDGRKFEYNPDWKDLKFKQETPEKDGMSTMMANQNFKFEGDGYYVEVKTDTSNGYKQETTTKFDNYFMYSMDYMGEGPYDGPECDGNPERDLCKEKVGGDDYCCTHVTMQDSMVMENSGSSFYRCMNEKIVDASFSFEIDGMKMSMKCMGSAASYFTGSAVLASIFAMVALVGF